MAANDAIIEAAPGGETLSANGWFQLSVPADGSTISIKKVVPSTGNGKPVETGDILKKLKGHRVTHGVDVNAIDRLLKLVANGQAPENPVVIASSEVREGCDGKLRWCIDGVDDRKTEVVVAPDMPVAVLRRAIKGSPGRNVYGKTKQPRPVFDPQLRAGSGIAVEENENGEFVYLTRYAGQLKLEDDTLFVEPNVSISEDCMCASMHVPAGLVVGAPRAITEQDILAVLADRNISHGILNENIRAALQQQGDRPGLVKDVLVAEGKPAREGKNAHLLVDEELAIGKLLDNGQIDYHERSYPWNIKCDEIIGRVLPAEPEENGFTVSGKVIPATPALGVSLTLDGVSREEDGTLRADRSGILLVSGSSIAVTDSLLIKGDVGQRTGNIRSDESVIVRGYVEPGFKVESRGDVIIEDNIEQAEVRASGSVVVKSGIRGSQSKIVSRGNISAGFMENTRAMALGDITVENSVVSCTCYCHGKLTVGQARSRKATIIGGSLHADRGIVATNLGSEGFKQTRVSIGPRPEILQKLRGLGEELSRIEGALNKLEHLFLQHRRRHLQRANETMKKVEETLRHKGEEYRLLKNEQEKLQTEVARAYRVIIEIRQHVYPGVSVQILDRVYEVRKRENAGIFFLEDELIIFRPAA